MKIPTILAAFLIDHWIKNGPEKHYFNIQNALVTSVPQMIKVKKSNISHQSFTTIKDYFLFPKINVISSWINLLIKDRKFWWKEIFLEMFYLNTCDSCSFMLWAVRPVGSLSTHSRLLAGITKLVVFQNLRWNSNKTSLYIKC